MQGGCRCCSWRQSARVPRVRYHQTDKLTLTLSTPSRMPRRGRDFLPCPGPRHASKSRSLRGWSAWDRMSRKNRISSKNKKRPGMIKKRLGTIKKEQERKKEKSKKREKGRKSENGHQTSGNEQESRRFNKDGRLAQPVRRTL